MTPSGGWVPAPPPGFSITGKPDESGQSFTGPAPFASSEEAYAFAQQQYFAAQQRARYEAAAFYGGARGVSTDGQSPSADAALAPNPPPTPPGAKKAAGGAAA